MNDVEMIVRAVRIEAEQDREAYLSNAYGEAQRQTDVANLATNQKDLALQKEAKQAEKERIARLNAEAMTKYALDANNAMAFEIQEELAPKPGLQELRMKLLRKAREGLTKILEQSRELGSPDATIVSTYY